MLLSTVSVLVVAQSSSEIPEELMNNPVLHHTLDLHSEGEPQSRLPRLKKSFVFFCPSIKMHEYYILYATTKSFLIL